MRGLPELALGQRIYFYGFVRNLVVIKHSLDLRNQVCNSGLQNFIMNGDNITQAVPRLFFPPGHHLVTEWADFVLIHFNFQRLQRR